MNQLHIYQSISKKNKENIFSANHRNAMIRCHGYTAAQSIIVDDLCFEATMEAEYKKTGLAF